MRLGRSFRERCGYIILRDGGVSIYETKNLSSSDDEFKMAPVWDCVPHSELKGSYVFPFHTHQVSGRLSIRDKDVIKKAVGSIQWRVLAYVMGFSVGGQMIVSECRSMVFVYNQANKLVQIEAFSLN